VPSASERIPGVLSRRPWLSVAAAGVLLLAIRCYLSYFSHLFPDEALYAWLGERLPFNFAPHPPGTPLLARAGTALLGKIEYGARLGSLVLGVLILLPLYALAHRIGGRAVGLATVLVYATTPVYVVFGAITTPDMPQLCIFTYALYFAWRALDQGTLRWWVACGLALTLGLYFKYILILFVPSLFLCMVLVPAWRRYFRIPGPYVLLACIAVLFLPVALYGFSLTHWSALKYHLQERQALRFFAWADAAAYQALHLVYYTPVFYMGAIAAMWIALFRGRQRGEPRLTFLACFALVPWTFFFLVSLLTERVLSREQWDATAYIPAYIAGILLFLPSRRGRRFGYFGILCGLITVAGVIVEVQKLGVARLFNVNPLFGKVAGWRHVGRAADLLPEKKWPNDPSTIIIAGDFAIAHEIAFYSKKAYPIFSLPGPTNDRYGLAEALDRGGMSLRHLQGHLGKNALIILVHSPSHHERVEKEVLTEMFENLTLWRDFIVNREGKRIRKYWVYYGERLRSVPSDAEVSEKFLGGSDQPK